MWVFWVILAVLVVVVVVLPRLSMSSIAPTELKRMLDDGGVLLDVRTASEFAGGSVPGASNLPVDQVANGIAAKVANKQTPIIVFCASGARSGMAASRLKGMGYEQVINLGGLGRAQSMVSAARSQASQ